MKEIVINNCFGGFSLSHEAIMMYAKLKKMKLYVEKDIISNNYYKVPPKQYKEKSEEWFKKDGDYRRIKAKDWYFTSGHIDRTDKVLIKVVKKLKEKASGRCAELKIIKIPNNVDYEIEEYDGLESVHETHRSWN